MKQIPISRQTLTWMTVVVVCAFAGAAMGEAYTLDTCPVTGGKLGSMGPPLIKEYNGREVRFCCAGCPAKFEASSERYLAEIDAKIVKQQKALYPLEVCLVDGKKLGSMGPALDYVYQNRLVRLCCNGSLSKFKKEPAKFLKQLDEAVIKKQRASYPTEVCLVSGEKLGGDMGDAIDHVIGNRLFRLCCKGCVKKVNAEPSKYLKMLNSKKPDAPDMKHEGSETKKHEDHSSHDH